MLLNFAGSGHPIFRGTSALERGELRSKENGKKSIHFIGSTQNIELLLHMFISVNQLSPVGQRAVGKPKAPLDKVKMFTQPLLAEVQSNEERQGNLLQKYEVIQTVLRSRFDISRNLTLPSPRGKRKQSLCRKNSMLRDQEGNRIKGWIQNNVRFGPVSDIKVCNHCGRYSIEVQVQSLFQDQTVSCIPSVNGIDKVVREAIPIQEEEKVSGNPLQKGDQY